MHVRSSVGQIYADAVARLGYPVDPERVEQAFHAAWKRSLERRRAANYISSNEVLRREWGMIVSDSFDGLVPPEMISIAFEELYDHFSGPDPWVVADGVIETFLELKSKGIAVGLLSNWDGRLPNCLEKLGILEFFDHLVISYEVGVEKPHSRIFEVAAKKTGARSDEILMVGDSFEQDILPARKFGWHTLWLTKEMPQKEGEFPVERVQNFGEVLAEIRALLRNKNPGQSRR